MVDLQRFFKECFCKDLSIENASLRASVNFYSKAVSDLRNNIIFLEDDIMSLKNKHDLLKDQIRDLLLQGKVNIFDFKDYYEKKYNSVMWAYNFRGQGLEDVKIALRYTPEGRKVLIEAAKNIINRYNLYENKTPEKALESVMKYFMISSNWTYKLDRGELWERAEDSWVSRVGDCDDLAILMHLMIYFIFLELDLDDHYWRLSYMAVGSLVGGHALNSWIGNDGEYYAIESTLDLKNSFVKTWLKTPMRYNNLYSNPWGFSRVNKSRKGGLDSFKDKKVS